MQTIKLTPIEPTILTAYKRGGATRTAGHVPHPSTVLTVKLAASEGWRLAPGAARDLLLLDATIIKMGGDRLRLVDAYRNTKTQAAARQKYDVWLQSGRPDPSSGRFNRRTMKTAYVSSPGESNHNWGGAIDIDVGALRFEGAEQGSDAALSIFWDVAKRFGWRPIIGAPIADRSESWHFDHLGALSKVHDLFYAHRAESARYRRPYPLVASVGCILANTMPNTMSRQQMRYIQARLLVAGVWCGEPDGFLGSKTIKAIKDATRGEVTRHTPPALIVGLLNECAVGYREIEEI